MKMPICPYNSTEKSLCHQMQTQLLCSLFRLQWLSQWSLLVNVTLNLKMYGLFSNIFWYFGFSGGSSGKESTSHEGGLGSIPELGRSPGEGNSCPLPYSGLENFMDCIVRGVAKSQMRLSLSLVVQLSHQLPQGRGLQPRWTKHRLEGSRWAILSSVALLSGYTVV